jgi:hypothetical protein
MSTELTLIEYDFDWGTRFPRRTAQWYVAGELSKAKAVKFVRSQIKDRTVNTQAITITRIELNVRYDRTMAGCLT